MNLPQFTIARMLCGIAFCGIAFAALRSPTELWAGCVVLMTLVVLLSVTLVALRGPEPGRTFGLGFALFGWTYAAMCVLPSSPRQYEPLLPTTWLFIEIYARLNPRLGFTVYSSMIFQSYRKEIPFTSEGSYFIRIGHSIFNLVFGAAGGIMALAIANRRIPAASIAARSEA